MGTAYVLHASIGADAYTRYKGITYIYVMSTCSHVCLHVNRHICVPVAHVSGSISDPRPFRVLNQGPDRHAKQSQSHVWVQQSTKWCEMVQNVLKTCEYQAMLRRTPAFYHFITRAEAPKVKLGVHKRRCLPISLAAARATAPRATQRPSASIPFK